MRTYYLDTSIAIHALRGTARAENWFDEVTGEPTSSVVSSRILRTELTRVLRRDAKPVFERDLILDHLDVIAVSESILASAEAITEQLKTLDAIHLATALAVGSETVVVSHDHQVKRVAGVLGLRAFDPITP